MSARRSLSFQLVLLIAVTACGSERRGGGTTILRRDGGGFLDAGTTPRDAGVATTRDGGPFVPGRDGGVRPQRDSGVQAPRDGGANPPRDAGPTQQLSIYDLQDIASPSYPGEGAAVELRDVVVTAIVATGGQAGSFYVQEPAGGPYSGIFVFLPMGVPAPTVTRGDRVSITGTLEEYFGLTEVVLASLLTRSPGSELTPTIISTPGTIATGGTQAEAYEAVLVEVQQAVVVSDNPDAPNDDFGEFSVTGGLRVDDALYRVAPRPPVGATVSWISGVLNYAFENFKLLPRDVDDVGPVSGS
ncbi:MAG: hypothetical protein RIT81_12550 [Deltaproteobacteria bacterium]